MIIEKVKEFVNIKTKYMKANGKMINMKEKEKLLHLIIN